MIRLAISVEGQTEEEFVKQLLVSHLHRRDVDARPVLIGRARGSGQGGGTVTIDRLVKDMRELKGNYDAVTSLVDFYGFKGKGSMSPDDLVEEIRNRIGQSDERFVFPYIQVHEFEGLLFSNVNAFKQEFDQVPIAELQSIRSGFDTPEDINDNPIKAPSKRIKELIPSYQKPVDGPNLAERIGLDRMRTECPRFNAWLGRLESLGDRTA